MPSLRSLVKGYAADCARAVREGGPNAATRSASGSSASTHGRRLDPVADSRPNASSTSSGLCG
jgi:hypothetical protein